MKGISSENGGKYVYLRTKTEVDGSKRTRNRTPRAARAGSQSWQETTPHSGIMPILCSSHAIKLACSTTPKELFGFKVFVSIQRLLLTAFLRCNNSRAIRRQVGEQQLRVSAPTDSTLTIGLPYVKRYWRRLAANGQAVQLRLSASSGFITTESGAFLSSHLIYI